MSRRLGVQPRSLVQVSLALATLVLAGSTLVATPAGAISHRRLFQPSGPAAHDQLGLSVSGGGDVNGDGYADVIVGAPQNSAVGTSPGNAYVYFGGPAADATADLTLTGAALVDRFGWSVAVAGDINGDGFDDLIVGARRNDAGGVDAGRAYIYFGGPTPDAVADLILTGAAAGDEFGCAVAPAGDVNRDGFDDLIVGANLSSAGGTAAGRAYLYFGGPTPNAVADLTLTGGAAYDQFGTSVASAGDVNGDGFGDLIVGANFNDAAGQNAGRAYVFFTGPAMDAIADRTFTGVSEGDNFGISVASAGDVNGDGYADVIVGADEASNWLYGGAAYLYLGGPNADATADVTISATDAYASVGASVASAGDLNADGYADWMVGIAGGGLNGEPARVHVYFGGPWPDGTADAVLVGDIPAGAFGSAMSSAGDVDGDGFLDVIVGAWTSDMGGYWAGRAYVTSFFPYQVLAPNGGERWVAGQQATVRWRGHDPADLSVSFDGGASWSTLAAQVGGLAENEHVVTVPPTATEYAMIRLSYSGQAAERSTSDVSDALFRIVLPTPTPTAAIRLDRTYQGQAAGDNFGSAVANAGDFNSDGFADLIVGASSNDAAGLNAGRAYVYYRGPGSDAVADVTLTGAAAGDVFGLSVAGAVDFNADGHDDVIVGAFLNDAIGNACGRAYLYFGGPSPNAIADGTFTGAVAGDQFGRAVANAGDVNGDGHDDLLVGAPGNDAGGADAGRAYVFFGGPNADIAADLTLTGQAAGDAFGTSVAGAGDVNGDGFDDVIVGANGNDAGGSNAGRAYVYYGGAVPNAVADLVLTGQASGDFFGHAVAGAGDLDGDGFADVIAGAYANDAGGDGAGRAYVYYGGSTADAIADLVMTGIGDNEQFGLYVAGVGDVNADGYDDMTVSAYASDVGRVDVFYGGHAMDAVPDLSLDDAPQEVLFGESVAGVGDVDGDGFDDLLIGATAFGVGGGAYVYHLNRYVVTSPNDDEVWNVGASQTIRWLGAEPADLWLSTDGGGSYTLLRSGVGGGAQNSVSLLVPHTPTRFARVKVTPADPAIAGLDESDSLFTIQSSVALLNLVATLGDEGAELSWGTEPSVGPQGLAGYRVYRLAAGESGNGTRVGPELIAETHYTDSDGAGGNVYRLVAVNGLQQELEVGRVSLAPRAALAAWPQPYRGGMLDVSFGVSGRFGSTLGEATVELFDLGGRKVKTLASGPFESGFQALRWDGRDDRGERVRSGIYFLRATSGGESRQIRLVVLQ